MKIQNQLSILGQSFNELINAPLQRFNDLKLPKIGAGVYIVYNKDKLIYIGHSKKIIIRLEYDLLSESTHILNKKLLKELGDKSKVNTFLKEQCRYKVKMCNDKRQAEALEHFVIWVLNPIYNQK